MSQSQKTRIDTLENSIGELANLVKKMVEPDKKASAKKAEKLPEKRELFSFSGKDFVIEEFKAKKDDHIYASISVGVGSAFIKRLDKNNADLMDAAIRAFEVYRDFLKQHPEGTYQK